VVYLCPCLIGAVEAFGSGSKPAIFSIGNFIPINFSISRKKTVSSGLNKEIASPLAQLFQYDQYGERNPLEY
jgi:hypothetical protein